VTKLFTTPPLLFSITNYSTANHSTAYSFLLRFSSYVQQLYSCVSECVCCSISINPQSINQSINQSIKEEMFVIEWLPGMFNELVLSLSGGVWTQRNSSLLFLLLINVVYQTIVHFHDCAMSESSFRLKKIQFHGKDVMICLQNENGPCPLLAISIHKLYILQWKNGSSLLLLPLLPWMKMKYSLTESNPKMKAMFFFFVVQFRFIVIIPI
jgi:hypothetical protein